MKRAMDPTAWDPNSEDAAIEREEKGLHAFYGQTNYENRVLAELVTIRKYLYRLRVLVAIGVSIVAGILVGGIVGFWLAQALR